MYYAGRGGGYFSMFFLSATIIMVTLYSACCAMPSWAIVVGSKLGSENGVTHDAKSHKL